MTKQSDVRLIGHLLCIILLSIYLSMKMAVFTDSPMNFVTPSGKRGQIPDEKGKIARLSGKRVWNPDRTTRKKETP